MQGLDAADAAGLKVKINAVALKGTNEDEIDDLIRFAHGRGYDLTLIETMPLGEIDADRTDQYLPLSIVRARLHGPLDARRHPARPAGRRATCASRDRRPPRLHHADDAQFLRELQPRPPHLHRDAVHVPRPGGRGRPARAAACGANDAALHAAIDEAMLLKPKGHDFVIDRRAGRPAVARHMSVTGG